MCVWKVTCSSNFSKHRRIVVDKHETQIVSRDCDNVSKLDVVDLEEKKGWMEELRLGR